MPRENEEPETTLRRPGSEPVASAEAGLDKVYVDVDWPRVSREHLHARRVKEDVYELHNMPCFAEDYCLGDRVTVSHSEDGLRVGRILSRCGRSKFLIMLAEQVDVDRKRALLASLRRLECSYEDVSEHVSGYVVVEVPLDVSVSKVRQCLASAAEDGLLKYHSPFDLDRDDAESIHETPLATWR